MHILLFMQLAIASRAHTHTASDDMMDIDEMYINIQMKIGKQVLK